LIPQKSENGDGESLIYGVSSMQGWRISMEDAHATVLDFAGEQGKPTGNDKRLAFFGVYDGHGGDKVRFQGTLSLLNKRLTHANRPQVRRGGFWLHCVSWYPFQRQDLRRMSALYIIF
jgi:hypothetical protein